MYTSESKAVAFGFLLAFGFFAIPAFTHDQWNTILNYVFGVGAVVGVVLWALIKISNKRAEKRWATRNDAYYEAKRRQQQ